MGLFSKRDKGVSDQVQKELEALGARLAETEQARADLEARLRTIDDANQALSGRITTLDDTNAQLDNRLSTLSFGLTTMGDRVGALSASTSAHDARLKEVDDLDARLDELAARLDRPLGTPSPPPPPPPLAAERLRELDELTGQLAAAEGAGTASDGEIAALRRQIDELTERMAAADERVTGVSTELANQLTELSRDIDALQQQRAEEQRAAAAEDATPAEGPDVAEVEARLVERLDAAIDDVHDSTERLAAEQARYEIQFRADLAELAERLRRPPTR